jgi:proteasome lid subunit RPN8/RPN11
MRAEKEAAKAGLSIVGIFHSHPDHPARASETDRQHAWPVYSYLIIAIHKGEYHDHHNWILNEKQQMVDEVCKVV